ncbi:amino acid adenylation domain-containing protein [Streptacidiphilus sp. MAP12-33]|uniref:amino acid adenylation domain-containing protein n=1 Tax=Streptacidiphilus sp. MAP12-33 TaxID=3156266 RepID=UPI0035180D92
MTAPTAPTQQELRAELMRRRAAAKAGRPAHSGIPRAHGQDRLELSAGQRQLWFLHQLDPDSPEYLLPMSFRLSGPLDARALRAAFDTLVARHEILRTRYLLRGTGPVQLVDPAEPADFAVEVRSGLAAADREAAAVAFTHERAVEVFDLTVEHPLRIRLLRLAEDDHVLSVVMHHIACDALTRPLLLHEVAACYRGERLPEPSLQYADYAAWLNARQADGSRAGLEWWRERLAGVAPLGLPTDRQRPAQRDWAGAVAGFDVPAGVAASLRGLATDGLATDGLAGGGEATLFMVLLTAYQALLGRWAGKQDVTVGTAVSGRVRPELQGMVGYAYNSLALRARWSGEPSFRELLAANRGTVLDAFDHQEVPFDRIADELEPERDLSTTPLFQVMFDLAADGGAGLDLPGVTAAPVAATGRIARFDLTMHLAEQADGSLHGSLEYAAALFDPATAERFTEHYTRLLAAVAAEPDRPLAELDFLSEGERQLLLHGRPEPVGTERPLDPAALRPVVEQLAAQARRTPQAVALRWAGGTTSFAELDAAAGCWARRLAELGAGPETTVGVLLDRSPELVAALLGIWRAGAAYVPIDPGYPVDRIAYMTADTGTRLVVTESRYADRFPAARPVSDGTDGADGAGGGNAPRLVLADDPAEQRARAAATAEPPQRHDLDQLAYVIYTSGSTGRPKGVLISHRGLANYLGWTVDAYASAGTGGAPLLSSVAFDLGVPDLFTPLLTGQPVHLLPQDFDTADLGALLAEAAPYAFIKLTPGHLDLLQQQLTHEQIGSLAGLVIAAGDSFTARLTERWAASAGAGGTPLAAEYGPTEITVGNSAYFVREPVATELVPIGRAIPNTTMYVLDDRLRPLPVGVVGEVWIGGVGLARGYSGRPDLTAEKFLPDPYGAPGARLYRTGDLARVLPDGELDFVARVDHQVKLRGYRIELGEIETALTADPAVAEAVALVREDSPGDRQLVAYVVAAPDADKQALGPAALRARLTGLLPSYMVPSAYLRLEVVPLTANGKLDRRALPAPGRAATAVGEHVAPRDATEAAVAAVWAEVLGLDEVGVHDNFFDLGGDSIRAVALVGALRAAGFETTVRDVFDRRTVARLGALLTENAELAEDGGAPQGPEAPVAPFALIGAEDRAALPPGVVDAYPVSLIQAGMLVEMHGADENRYHNITSFRIRDDRAFDPGAFQRSADLIVARHEVMRTSFALAGYARPLQLVHATGSMPVVVDDLRGLPRGRREQALWEFADADRAVLFDLERAPLMRMAVHLLDEESWWLSITECHPVIEGWSYHSQLMELLRAYDRIVRGLAPEPAPPAPAVRYADFIAAELRSLDDPADREFWRGVVEDHERFTIPAGWAADADGVAGPAGGGDPDERYRLDLPLGDLEPGLRALASAAEVPYKSVLHAAHSKVLSLLTPASAFRGGMVADARPERAGAERVSGMYLNSVPFPYRRAASTWGELAREVFTREIELWPHRRFPMPAMRRPGGERHLIDVLFHYLDFHQVDTELIDIMASRDDSPNEFRLVVGTPVRGHLSLASRSGTVTRAHAERLMELYRAVLTDMVATGVDGGATGAFPDAAELARLAAPARPHPAAPRDPLAAFEAQAAATPDATALRYGAGAADALSYAELDARAERFAAALTALGAGRESRVAVLLDRGPELVAALLGVWKAGAAQVPVDPATPDARLRGFRYDLAITQAAHADRLRPAAPRLLVERLPFASVAATRPETLPEQLAYVLHTSGSTGTPKGVEISRAALAHYLDHAVRQYAPAGTGGAPSLGSIGFDLGLAALWAPLMTGQSVHLLPPCVPPGELGARLLEGAPYAFLGLTPGQLALLEVQLTDNQLNSLAALVVCAGDAYPAAQAARLRRRAPGLRLAAEYGPTEATVAATACEVPESVARALVPLGRPLPGAVVRLLDDELRPVPDGVVGEVWLGGAGLARGYADRPLLTADRFLPDPYGPPGSRLYRTGDLARHLADGALEFTGRADEQLKINGHRVELGEVEAALAADPQVRDALVLAVDAADGGRRLAAWVVPLPGTRAAELSVPALRDRLRTVLPTALLPSTVRVVEELPLTGHGKRDKAALAALTSVADRSATSVAVPFTAPRTATERLLASLWAEVLGLSRVGVDDDFRDLGGDSLLVPPLLLAAAREGLRLDLATALRHHTVARIAAALDASGHGVPAPAPVLDASSHGVPAPATRPQSPEGPH